MGIIIKNCHAGDKVKKTTADRAKSQLSYIAKGEDIERVEKIWWGNTLGEGSVADSQIVALSEANPLARNPTRHLVISWGGDEFAPDDREIENALATLLAELGLDGCLYKAAIHRDTGNRHLHVVVCTADPDTMKMRHTSRINDRCQRAIALHNHALGRPPHAGDRYTVANGVLMARSCVRTQMAIRVEKANRATSHEKISAIDVAKARVVEQRVREATTWLDFHNRLAECGMKYERIGTNMARVSLMAYQQGREEYLKASQIDRNWTLSALEKRFGNYFPSLPSMGVVRNQAAEEEAAQQEAIPAPWDIYKREKAAALAASREHDLVRKQAQAAARRDLSDRHKRERAMLAGPKGYWRGKGAEYNRAKSLIAQRHAIEKIELREQQRGDRKGPQVFPNWNIWRRRQAGAPVAPSIESAGGGELSPSTPRDLRDFAGRAVARGVEYFNKQTGQVEFVDVGGRLNFGASHSQDAIRAGLQLAVQKWGSVTLYGNDEFQMAVILEAHRLGVERVIRNTTTEQLQHASDVISSERKSTKASRDQRLAP